jgi:hypothetical protein
MSATPQLEHKAADRRERVTVDRADVDSSATWTIDFKPRPAGSDGATDGRRPQRRALGVSTLDYLDGRIMGGIFGRTLSHDLERAWGFVGRPCRRASSG